MERVLDSMIRRLWKEWDGWGGVERRRMVGRLEGRKAGREERRNVVASEN